MSNLYALRDLRVERALEDGDDLSDLNFMKTVGPHAIPPIVIKMDGVILDGVRRYEKARKLGWDYLVGVKSRNVEEVSAALAENHTKPLTRWVQVADIVAYLRFLNKERTRAYRRGNITGTRVPIRDLVGSALGGLNPSNHEKVGIVLQHPHLSAKLLAGEISPAGAYNIMLAQQRQRGHVEDPAEQMELYQSALRQLQIVVESLRRMGEITIAPSEATELRKQYKYTRNRLNIVMNRLEEAMK